MYRIIVSLLVAATWLAATGLSAEQAKDKKGALKGPLELRIVLAKDSIPWDAGGKAPKEFQKQLEEIEELQKAKKRTPPLPPAPKLALTLEVRNTSNEDVTIHVGGDVNQYAFELKGPGVKVFNHPVIATADFRGTKPVTLAPGKSHEIKITQLEDGFRGLGRRTYWTDIGDFTLKATYRLGTADGGQGALLTSEPVKFKVVEGK